MCWEVGSVAGGDRSLLCSRKPQAKACSRRNERKGVLIPPLPPCLLSSPLCHSSLHVPAPMTARCLCPTSTSLPSAPLPPSSCPFSTPSRPCFPSPALAPRFHPTRCPTLFCHHVCLPSSHLASPTLMCRCPVATCQSWWRAAGSCAAALSPRCSMCRCCRGSSVASLNSTNFEDVDLSRTR